MRLPRSVLLPGKAAPHVALDLLDLAGRKRNAQARPKAFHALERPFLGRFSAEAGSMSRGLLLLLRRNACSRDIGRLSFIIRRRA